MCIGDRSGPLCSGEFHALSGPVLRDTARLSQRSPPIARYGVFGVPTWPIGCDTPSLFAECFPLGEHAKWRCDTPLKRGISAILARYPMKTRQMGAIPPSAILSRKGIARYGGVSRTKPLSSRFAGGSQTRTSGLGSCCEGAHRPVKPTPMRQLPLDHAL